MDELICPICSNPTRVYMGNARKDRLCGKHADMLKYGDIFISDDGLFVDAKTKKVLNKDSKIKTFFKNQINEMFNKETAQKENTENSANANIDNNKVIIVNENNKSRCITCGKKTDGLLFCADCYRKYSKKELLFKITSCSNVELLDEDYEGRYTCKDGHVVKSKSERDIDNYLFENDIPHAYEKALPYGKNENEVLHPDFYLPHYLGKGKHVYIEHWGYNENNLQYKKTKKFKLPIYKNLGITLICTYEKSDAGNIDSKLERKLNKQFIEESKINFEE